jgi:hypothetical protein
MISRGNPACNRCRVYVYILRIWPCVMYNCCQPLCIGMVICHATASAYACIGVCLPVSLCINYPRRVRVWRCLYRRPVNIYSIVGHTWRVRPAGVVNFVYCHTLMGNLLNICRAWPGYIRMVIVHIGIINDSGIVYNVNYPCMRHVIVIYPWAVDITVRRANPIIIGHIIAPANYNGYGYTGIHWCPAVIATGVSPAYPSRCPFMPRDPFPSIIIIIMPPAVMESSPSPWVV